MVKEVPPILTHDEELRVGVLFEHLLGLLDDVHVVAPGETLVRRDDEAAVGSLARGVVVRGVEVGRVHVLHRAERAVDLAAQRLEVGARVRQLELGLAELGRGDEIHGVGDLPRLADAVDAILDLLRAGHVTHHAFRRPDSCRGTALPASESRPYRRRPACRSRRSGRRARPPAPA